MPRTCLNCDYDLTGLDPRTAECCPECGIDIRVNAPGRVCPKCEYEFAGLSPDIEKCPECGEPIDPSVVRKLWAPESRRWWKWFWFAPPLSSIAFAVLSGMASSKGTFRLYPSPVGILLGLLVGWMFAYLALRAEVAATPRAIARPLHMVGHAFSYTFQWTILNSLIVGMIGAVVMIALEM